MAAKTNNTTEQIITIKPIRTIRVPITIVGETPLIVHAWSEKAKRMMLEAQQKTIKAKKAREIRHPMAEFVDSMYWLTPKPNTESDDGVEEVNTTAFYEEAIANGARFGFPISAIKQAALSACYRAGLIPNQTGMKAAFFITGNNASGYPGEEIVEIDAMGEAPVCREDMVKIGGISKSADLRYRAAFVHWKMHLLLYVNDFGTFSVDSIVNAINLGGQANGLGEWRMERDGIFGRYHVEVEGK